VKQGSGLWDQVRQQWLAGPRRAAKVGCEGGLHGDGDTDRGGLEQAQTNKPAEKWVKKKKSRERRGVGPDLRRWPNWQLGKEFISYFQNLL
jgi:hypothetical protein